jgi:hypothetical protein
MNSKIKFKVGQTYYLMNGYPVTIIRIFKDGSARASCHGKMLIVYPEEMKESKDE